MVRLPPLPLTRRPPFDRQTAVARWFATDFTRRILRPGLETILPARVADGD